jgi:PKD repeat protein
MTLKSNKSLGKKAGFTGLFVVSVMLSFGQLRISKDPKSFQIDTKNARIIPSARLDSLHISARLAEDKALGIRNRIGIVSQLNVDVKSKGVKTEIAGEGTIWQYQVESPDARSLSIFFSRYHIPDGATVHIYSSDKTRVAGAFTSDNNPESGQMPVAAFKGNSLVVEYFEPENAAFGGELQIGTVSQAYRELSAVASSSQIDLTCREGEGWGTEKHSVCLMTFNDSRYEYYCTGSLVNNVREDGTPYFLTANHCISTNAMAQTLVTYFNYENSTCGGSDASLDQTLAGASLVANNSYSDFSLLKLNEYPPDEYSPYYAGFDASANKASSTVCIHHPQGMPKSIATDDDAPTSNNYTISWDDNSRSMPNSHWEVSFESGNTEAGSSGSPLFNQDKRVIGQLHGGDDSYSLYGKFSVSWNYSSIASKQLAYWLDPDNTGTKVIDGFLPHVAPRAAFKTEYTLSCTGTPVSFTDESSHSPKSWLWKVSPSTVEFTNGTDSTSQNPEISFLAEGVYAVTLITSNPYGSDTLTKSNLIYATANLPVSLENTPDEMTICGYELEDYELVAGGANSYSFDVSKADHFTVSQSGNTLTLTLKDAIRKDGAFDSWIKVTGTHGNCSASDSVLVHVVMPQNDDIANAIRLEPGKNVVVSNQCGTVETYEPSPDDYGCTVANNWCPDDTGTLLNNSVWFTFRGPSSGWVTITTEGFDNQIAVYDAGSSADLLSGSSGRYTLLAANDDNSTSGAEARIENLAVEPGKIYWLQVDGNNSAYGKSTIYLLSNSLDVYPNPSDGLFNAIVSNVDERDAVWTVYNLQGGRVASGSEPITHESNKLEIDLSAFRSGIYLLNVRIGGSVLSKKLVLTK